MNRKKSRNGKVLYTSNYPGGTGKKEHEVEIGKNQNVHVAENDVDRLTGVFGYQSNNWKIDHKDDIVSLAPTIEYNGKVFTLTSASPHEVLYEREGEDIRFQVEDTATYRLIHKTDKAPKYTVINPQVMPAAQAEPPSWWSSIKTGWTRGANVIKGDPKAGWYGGSRRRRRRSRLF
jgi:hypothetical protein